MKKHIPITAVIFDIGNVLVELDFEKSVRAAAVKLKLPADEIQRRIFGNGHGFYTNPEMPYLTDYEVGRISDKEFHRRVEKLLGTKLSSEELYFMWNALFGAPITANIRLARALLRRPGMKVGVLSNTNSLHTVWLKKNLPVLNDIEHLCLSQEIRARKPEALAFRRTLKRMAVAPQAAVFIDDIEKNVEAARSVGMYGIHATSVAVVRAELEALGVFKKRSARNQRPAASKSCK